MTLARTLAWAVLLGAQASAVFAQVATEPVLLALPIGARVRFQTAAAPGLWIKGFLASADASSVAIVPEDAPPFGPNQLRVPTTSVAHFQIKTGSKRQWLWGLVAGAALGVAVGATADVNPATCDYSYSYEFCSRGEAVAASVLVLGATGAGIGALIKTDRWAPVALEALAPPPRVSGIVPRLRPLPGGGVGFDLAAGF